MRLDHLLSKDLRSNDHKTTLSNSHQSLTTRLVLKDQAREGFIFPKLVP